MKYLKGGFFGALVLSAYFGLTLAFPLSAHPEHDQGIGHYLRISARPEGLEVKWEMFLGEVLLSNVFQEVDSDRNGLLSQKEIRTFLVKKAPFYQQYLRISFSPPSKDLSKESYHWEQSNLLPSDDNAPGIFSKQNTVGVHRLRIMWTLLTPWPSDRESVPVYVECQYVQNLSWMIMVRAESIAPVFWLSSDIPDEAQCHFPSGESNFHLDQTNPTVVKQAHLWVGLKAGACIPDIGEMKNSDGVNATFQREPVSGVQVDSTTGLGNLLDHLDSLQNNLRDETRILIRQGGIFSIVLILILVFIWGAAHALTPGHGKTIATAFLIGHQARWSTAWGLAFWITVSHTSVIIMLSLAAMILGEAFVWPQWIEPLAAGIIVLIGLNMMRKGIRRMLGTGSEEPKHHHHEHEPHHHEHEPHHHTHTYHTHDHGPHGHSHVPAHLDENLSFRELALAGLGGGMVPCPAAVVLFLFSLQTGKPVLGVFCILVFSLGLGVVLGEIGMMALFGSRLIRKWTETPDSNLSRMYSSITLLGGFVLMAFGVWRLQGFGGGT